MFYEISRRHPSPPRKKIQRMTSSNSVQCPFFFQISFIDSSLWLEGCTYSCLRMHTAGYMLPQRRLFLQFRTPCWSTSPPRYCKFCLPHNYMTTQHVNSASSKSIDSTRSTKNVDSGTFVLRSQVLGSLFMPADFLDAHCPFE